MRRLKYLLLILFYASFNQVFSQPPPPGGSGPSCWPPPCVPVDQGWYVLFAAGLGLGIHVIISRQSVKSKTT